MTISDPPNFAAQPSHHEYTRFGCCLMLMLTLVAPVYGQENSSPDAEPKPAEPEAASVDEGKAEVAEGNATGADADGQETSPTTTEEEVEIPFKSLPYTVHVSIGFEPRCLPDVSQRENTAKAIHNAIFRMYGRMWDAEVELNDWMVPANRRHLDWLNVENMLTRFPEEQVHKAFIVAIESSGSSFVISAREFDSRIHELTPVATRVTYDVRAIPSLTVALLRDLFRPCALFLRKFQSEDGRELMELQVQAGEIIPPDPSAEQVVENDVLRPFVRQMDRRNPNKLDHLRRLDLSYIRVLDIDRGEASDTDSSAGGNDTPVTVPLQAEDAESSGDSIPQGGHSPGKLQGFYITHHPMSPFGAKSRKLQHFAVRQRPAADQSKVRIVLRGRPDKPLVSHRLSLAYQLHWQDPEDGPQLQLVSDRNGDVVIDRKEGHPTFWIRVYSGASLLARVPYAPGLIPFDTIELPDDSIRLGVEGEIQLLADKLIDAIALRSVLLARARKMVETGDVDGVEAMLDRRSKVPGKDYFLAAIKNIRIPAENEAKRRRLSPRLSVKLCEGLETTVNTFFSEEKRGEELREISTMRATAKKNAGGN